MKNPLVQVSDHAVLRYLERVMLVDVEGLRGRIGRHVDQAVKYGANGISVDGFSYKIRNNTVITVLEKSRGRKARRQVRRSK